MNNDEVIEYARRWAKLHANPKLRGRMDNVIDGLSEEDARRVVLCGQRIAGGLTIKVVPASPKVVETKVESKPKRKSKKIAAAQV